jgi:hypothetical protein
MNFLPGWSLGFIASKVQVQLTHIATTTGSSSGSTGGVTHPASGIEPGDLLVYVAGSARTSSADPPEMDTPSGYTQIRFGTATPGGNTGYAALSAYKIAVGNEDGTSVQISEGSDAQRERGAILQFRPSSPIGSVTIVEEQLEITTNNPAAQALGGTGIPASVVVGFYMSQGNAITSRSMSPTEDGEAEMGSNGDYVMRKVFNPPDTAVETTCDMDDHGNNILHSFMLLCEP